MEHDIAKTPGITKIEYSVASNTHYEGKPSGSDDISLSEKAGFLYRLSEKIASISVIDEIKVNSLKTQINTGSYQSDYSQVAEKMIDTERTLTNLRLTS